MATLPDVASLLDLFPQDFEVTEPQEAPEREQDRDALVRLSPERERLLLRQLRAHYKEATTGRDENQQQREDRYRRFLSDPSTRDGLQPWQDAPRLFLPMTRNALERLQDEFEQTLWDTFDKIQIKGFGEEDVEQARRLQGFFTWQLERVNNWRSEGKAALQDALLDGLGIVKSYPFRQPWKALHPDAALFDVIGKIETVDVGTMLTPVDATGLQWPECRFLGQQLFTFLDEFPSLARRGFRLPDEDMIRAMATQNPRDQHDDERRLLGFWLHGFNEDEADLEHDPQVEMVEQYELFDLRDEGEREHIVCHWFPHLQTNQSGFDQKGHIARIMRLQDAVPQTAFLRPTWPFFPVTVWPQARQLRGLSLIDRLESSQDALNRIAEQMIQAGEINLLPIVFANVALAGDIPDLTRVAPGTVVPIEGLGTAGQVQFAQRPAQTREFLELQQVIRSWGEEDSGVTAFNQGRTPDQPNTPRTVGGLALLLQQGNKGFKQQTIHLADQFTPAFRMLHSIWQDRMVGTIRIPMPQTETIEGRLLGTQTMELVEVRRDDLSGIFDITVRHNPDAIVEMQRKLALAERLDAILAGSWPLGRRALWKDLWESFGLQQFDMFWPEEIAVIQTQILVAQAMFALQTLQGQAGATGQPSELARIAEGEAPVARATAPATTLSAVPPQTQRAFNVSV